MAFGRGHASFTIDTLKLTNDSLPAAVTEPPPVFPELLNSPHPLIENSAIDYDYTLKLKLNFNSSFRTLHNSSKDDQEKRFILNTWKEEWSLLPRELKQASRINTRSSVIKPNLSKNNKKKKTTTFNIDLNTYEEKQVGENDDEQEEEKNDENADIDENDVDEQGKSKGADSEKKKLTDNENEVDGEIPIDEEGDMDEDEAADYISSYFDPGDGDDDDYDEDGGDGGD